MFKFLQTYALASSNYMLVALAMDRHRVVTKPLSVISSHSRLKTQDILKYLQNQLILQVTSSSLDSLIGSFYSLLLHL